MYIEFLLLGLNVKYVYQDFIDKCRQRMPLAVLGKCSIKKTLEGFIPPSEYNGVYKDYTSNQQVVGTLENQVQNNEHLPDVDVRNLASLPTATNNNDVQEVGTLENQGQNNEHLPDGDLRNLASLQTEFFSQEDLAAMNQLVSNHGATDIETILTYYQFGDDTQEFNNGMIKIGKNILGKILLPSEKGNDDFMPIDYHAEKVQVIHINDNVTMPTSDKDTMFLVVVVLPNEETKSTGIESNILPRGKKAKNIIEQLPAGSVYWLRCKTDGCCKKNSIDCPIHCNTHTLKLNDKITNRVVVISFVKNDWAAFIPPGEVDPGNTSIVVKFEDTIYRSIPCDGDGLCLFYSVSNFLQDIKDKTKEDYPVFSDKMSYISSGIIDKIWKFISMITADDMNMIIDRYPLDDIEDDATQWQGNKISNMSEKHNDWVLKFMTEITNAWNTTTERYPFEAHALILSWIFKIRIQIIQDKWDTGYYCAFDSHSESNYWHVDVQNIKQRYDATCVLLHCNGTIPLKTCHWNSRFIHYEYLKPINNPTKNERNDAYTGGGGTSNKGLHPWCIYHDGAVGMSTNHSSMVASSDEAVGMVTIQQTEVRSENKTTLLGVGGRKTMKRTGENTPEKTNTTSTTPTEVVPSSNEKNQVLNEGQGQVPREINQIVLRLKDEDIKNALEMFKIYCDDEDDSKKKSRLDEISVHCGKANVGNDIVKYFITEVKKTNSTSSHPKVNVMEDLTPKKRGPGRPKKSSQDNQVPIKKKLGQPPKENDKPFLFDTAASNSTEDSSNSCSVQLKNNQDNETNTESSPPASSLINSTSINDGDMSGSTAAVETKVDEGSKQGGSNAKVGCQISKNESSKDSSEEISNTAETNNNNQLHNDIVGHQNIHYRHSKERTVQVQPNYPSELNKLPRNLQQLMAKASKLKNNTKDKAVNSKESIGNDLTLFRSQQKEAILNEKEYLCFGELKSHQQTMTSQKLIDRYIGADELNTERKSSAENFLLLPLHLVTQDDIAQSSSFIYVSALSQMYTYLLYCNDIHYCPWVLDMLKKNRSGNKNELLSYEQKNMQCLVLLHSPTIIKMNNLKQAIKTKENDNDDEDCNVDGCNGFGDEYWSSLVFVKGCLFTEDGTQLLMKHLYPTHESYTQFLSLEKFLLNFAFNGLLESTPLFVHQEKWPTIASLMEEHYTQRKNKRQGERGRNFNFQKTMKRYIDINTAIIDVKNRNIIDTSEDDTSEKDKEDNETIIICNTANGIALDIAVVIELLFEHGKKEMKKFSRSWSIEDIACSEARIQFYCEKDTNGAYKKCHCDSFVILCKCCGANIYTNGVSLDMDDLLNKLPDAMICHFFNGKLSNIDRYLFDPNFDPRQIVECNNVDYVKFLDALHVEVSEESMKDIDRVRNAIFQRKYIPDNDVHPFEKLMCTILHQNLPNEQTRNEINQGQIYQSELQATSPSSKNTLVLDDANGESQPSINQDEQLMSQMKFVTKVDWSSVDDMFTEKSWDSLIPLGEKWQGLADLVGNGKHFHNFHWTGLLPYLMNQKNKKSDCELTKVYKDYPPASYPYAFMGVNRSIESVVYIGETHIKSKFTDTLKWLRAQKDIIELEEETIENETVYVFQFVLGDYMVYLYSEYLLQLKHNQRTPISKKLRCAIRSNVNSYQFKHNCEVTVKSTFPFRAIATNPLNDGSKKELEWMDILWLIYSIHGGDSYKGCLLRQLLSSPCYIDVGTKYTTNTTCIGCGSLNESETISTEQPAVVTEDNLGGSNLHSSGSLKESETVMEKQPTTVVIQGRTGLRKRVLEIDKNSPSEEDESKRTRPGRISIKCTPGCRMDSQDRVYPRSNYHSHKLPISLSSFKLNCLIGNTHNTMDALGHGNMFEWETLDALSNESYFCSLVHKLGHEYQYCIALSRLMTKDNSLKFEELEECINSAKVPTLIILNMTYSGGQFRQHLIGIVPSVTIDNKTEMHIVDGYHKDLKSFPLNEENLKWCCSGCISYFIEQFVFFTPGRRCLHKLSTLRGPNDNSCGTYITTKSSKELLEFIPTKYRNQKRKRKR